MKKRLHARLGYKELWAYRLEPETMRVVAMFYWLALLATASLVMLAMLTYGFWMLMSALGMDDLSGPAPSLSATPFSRIELQETLRGFDERVQRFDARKVDSTEFTSPFSAAVQ